MPLFPSVGPRIEKKTRWPAIDEVDQESGFGEYLIEALNSAVNALEYGEPRSGFLTFTEAATLRTATRLFLRGEPPADAEVAHGMYERSKLYLQKMGVLEIEASEMVEV